jgi:hypothetical protein
MNDYQKLWWQQAGSDLAVLRLLRSRGVTACHQLHYLQMTTEKISKAFFWKSGTAPSKSHAGFVQFLRFLGSVRSSERQQVAELFEFARFEDFRSWIRSALPLAYALERMAPALAQDDGPNAEYPWPRSKPAHTPATFEFEVWKELAGTGRGRQLLQVIELAVQRFPVYG